MGESSFSREVCHGRAAVDVCVSAGVCIEEMRFSVSFGVESCPRNVGFLWGKAKLVHEKEKRGEEKFRAVVAILLVVLLLVRLLALSTGRLSLKVL